MGLFVITYDLAAEGQNYDCIIKKIKSYPAWAKLQQSVWIVETPEKAKEIRDDLSGCLDSNDKLFVGKLTGEAAWWNQSDKFTKWFKECLTD